MINLFLILFLFSYSQPICIPVIVDIEGIESREGVIQLCVSTDKDSFNNGIYYLERTYSKAMMKDGRLRLIIDLPIGTYGIAVLDDVNNDGKMNYNLLGIPKEGYGFSNYRHRGIKKPDFSDFKCIIDEQHNKVSVKLKYLYE